MLKGFLVIFSLLYLALPALAEVDIPKEHRISNRPPGYCAWASLETLGNHQNISLLKGLVDYRTRLPRNIWVDYGQGVRGYEGDRAGATPRSVSAQLDALGVSYQSRSEGAKDYTFLTKNLEAGRGVMIGLGSWSPLGAHAVTVVDLTEEYVTFIDSNNIKHRWWHTRAWFDRNWSGWAVVVMNN